MKNFKLFIATLVLTVFSVNVWGETRTENFTSSSAADNNYNCQSTWTNTNKSEFNYTWSNPSSGTIFQSGIKLGKSDGTGSTTSSDILADIPVGTKVIIKVYAAVWNNDGGKVSLTYNGNTEIKDATNAAITSTTAAYDESKFTKSTDFEITIVKDVVDLAIASTVKRLLIDKIEVNYTSCIAPATPLSITSAATVKTGKTITLASTGGNGGTVEWSVTNGTGTASIANGILTAGNVGTVTVKAHQDQNGTTCETDAEQTVTISAITFTDYITECSSDPSISVSTTELNGFTYVYGQGLSAAKTVTVNGFYLQNNVTVTVSDNYEICLSQNGTYTSAITLTPADQMVNAPVYVRLKAGKEVNSYNGTLTVASAGLDSKTVSLSGSVTRAQLATPSVTATPDVHQITLTWDAVPNASSYQLVWNDGAAETVTSPVTKTNLTGGQSYSYSLVAVGSGNYTNSAAATGNQTAGKETFTVTWNIGANQETTANIEEGTLFSSLTPPTVADDAAGDCANKFIGWAIEAISSSEGVEENQVSWVNTSSAISASNNEFYAVFAEKDGGDPASLTLDFANNTYGIGGSFGQGTFTTGESSFGYEKSSVSNNVLNMGGNPSNPSCIYNKTSFGNITSIEITKTQGDLSCKTGDAEISGYQSDGAAIFTNLSGGFFNLSNTGSNTAKISQIVINYSTATYSNYITQCAPTFEISASTENGSILWSLNGDEFSSTIGKQPEGRTVYFQLQPDLHYQVSGTHTSSDVSINNLGSGIYSFTMPAAAVTISASFTLKSTVTVTFKNNGETLTDGGTREVYVGEAIGELPVLTSSDACDETSTTFMGWTDATITTQSSAPTMISLATIITTAQTYNAVWAEQTGEEEPVVQSTVTPSATFSNYYANIDGKSGDELRTTLETIISTGYSEVSYDNLKYLLKYADTENANGVDLIDIYSPCTFTISDEITWSGSCSGVTNVGCGLNREHTVPQSWFNEQAPMVSDAFHIYAVDAASNGHRSNYFYGECTSGTSYTGANCNEAGKLGSSSRQGYNGIVYEPADEYKGDIARGFFYMATRYATQCSSWSNMFGSNKGLTDYTVALMLDWHRQDPVSEKELIRNEVIYGNSTYNPSAYKQNNRNPFIDYPELIDYIWGTKSSESVSLTNLVSAYGGSSIGSVSYSNYLTQCATTATIKFDMQGHGTAPATLTEQTVGTEITLLPSVSDVEGYKFLGWSETASGEVITSFTPAKAKIYTLYAKWSAVPYGIAYTETTNLTWGEKPATINIETDMLTANYTVTNGYEVTSMTVTVGGNAIAADDIDYDQTHVDIMTTFSGAVVIIPIVTPIHYTITYLKNDGSESSSTQEAIYMVNVTLKNGTAFKRKGYTIDHWETEDGQTSYEKGYEFTPYNLTSDLTLKAIWAVKAEDWYTITFVDQLQDTEVDPISGIKEVDAFTFPTLEDRDTPPDDTGQCNIAHYHFVGWVLSTELDQLGITATIHEGGSKASVTANATYYAIWATATMD